MLEKICVLCAICIFLILLFVCSTAYKESFLSACGQYTDCTSCARSSGCSWCPQSNVCLDSTTLKSTDTSCNQTNTIASEFTCSSGNTIASDSKIANSPIQDPLYANQIADKVKPPNAYANPDMEYSPETVMANLTDIRNTLAMYQQQLFKREPTTF